MSILLEALRKSEQRQRHGQIPGLATPAPEVSFADDRGFRWRPVWFASAALILLLLLFGAWRFLPGRLAIEMHSPDLPAAAPQEEAAQVRGDVAAAGEGTQLSDAPGALDTGPQRQTVAGDPRPETAVPRSPVESLPREPVEPPVPRAAVETPSQPREATVQRSEAPGPPPAAQEQPAVIGYWELPAPVRDGLPELRITVLVYAERPEDRFVLMDGRRWSEGDELADGLRLQEIRRDGAVLSYRLYRFLREQG